MVFQFSELPGPVIRHLNGLWRQRWLVVAITWLAALAGWFVIWTMPDEYESRAHVFVQTETILEPVLNGFTARPDYTRRVEVMRLQLLTRPNVQEIVLRAGLDENIEATNDIEHQAKMESLINTVAGAITIDSPRDMYFVISYRNNDAETARRVVDAVMNMLIEQDLGASLSENQAARRRLDLQIEDYEEKLAAAERRLAQFRRENAAELAASQGAVRQREQKESELVRINDEIERTRGRILTLQNLLSATARTSSGDELDKLKVALADLRSRYEESHPDIRGLVARIDQLENSGGGELSSNREYIRLRSELGVARDSIAALESREDRLKVELADLDRAVTESPAVVAEVQQYERRYDAVLKTYEQLIERRDRLNLTENLGPAGRGVEYQVFERPERALVPVDPPRFFFSLCVFVLAPLAGIGAAVLMTFIDKSYSQAEELREAFGLPVLGAISEVSSEVVNLARRRDAVRLVSAAFGLLLVGALFTYMSVFRLPAELDDAGKSASVVQGTHR
ncbi:MAG: hypothetical protein HKP25_12330 [Marinicaulis sp.]|nr:hypothetical protein [Marinicaulis sp.]